MVSHFRSRNKHGGHIIRSAIVENPMLHANFMAVCFIEFLPIAVLHYRNMDLRPLVLLWPKPDDLHIWTWSVFPWDTSDVRNWTSYSKPFESYRITDIQTRLKLYTMLLRGCALQVVNNKVCNETQRRQCLWIATMIELQLFTE